MSLENHVCMCVLLLQEEMDKRVLKFQNQKLGERIEMRKKVEEDLRKRIEQLEQRQTTDDAVLYIVNRYTIEDVIGRTIRVIFLTIGEKLE